MSKIKKNNFAKKYFFRNKLTDVSCKYIAEGLKHASNLKYLCLFLYEFLSNFYLLLKLFCYLTSNQIGK